jgi:hypothetical protein
MIQLFLSIEEVAFGIIERYYYGLLISDTNPVLFCIMSSLLLSFLYNIKLKSDKNHLE